MSDTLNALSQAGMMSGQQQGQSSLLNMLSRANVADPANSTMTALEKVALLKFLSGQGQGSVRATAVPGQVSILGGGGNAPGANAGNGSIPVVPIGADGKPLSGTAPSVPATTSPGWFMPNTTAANQGNSVYSGGRYTDTSPGTLPYPQWQQGQGTSTSNATANTMNTPYNAWNDVATSIGRDPSDANVNGVFTALHNSGFGTFSGQQYGQVLAMTPGQRVAWAQQQLQPQTQYGGNTVSTPSNATDLIRKELQRFQREADTGLDISNH